jgi:aryl-alcohol dehydrogenase-like predicted oxidoreductase
MIYRKFGTTGIEVSALGLGCGYLSDVSANEGKKIIECALAAGITYFDVAPSYPSGKPGLNEKILSEALGNKKDEVFIATKVLNRKLPNDKDEVDGSLGRLKKIDLLQLHSVDTQAALEAVMSPDGSLNLLRALREEGVISYIGITNHHDPAVLEESFRRYRFDAAMMPLGVINGLTVNFEHLAQGLLDSGTAVIGILVFGSARMASSAELALRYSLSLPASVILTGPKTVKELERDIETLKHHKPLTQGELEELQEFTKRILLEETPWWQKRPMGIR